MASVARSDLPSYRDLIYPMLRVVASLGGSAQGSEIVEALIASLEVTPEQLAVTYPGRPKSVLIDRMDWARSYAKLGGALDSPQRGLFVLSNLGKHILSLTLIIHAGSWLPLTARSAVQMAGILLCGYDGLPAGGPVPRGSTGPEWVSTGRRDRFAQVSQGRGGL